MSRAVKGPGPARTPDNITSHDLSHSAALVRSLTQYARTYEEMIAEVYNPGHEPGGYRRWLYLQPEWQQEQSRLAAERRAAEARSAPAPDPDPREVVDECYAALRRLRDALDEEGAG